MGSRYFFSSITALAKNKHLHDKLDIQIVLDKLLRDLSYCKSTQDFLIKENNKITYLSQQLSVCKTIQNILIKQNRKLTNEINRIKFTYNHV